MKIPLATIGIALALAFSAAGGERTITTKSGKVFERAEIKEIDGPDAVVSHAGGLTKIPANDLPMKVYREFEAKDNAKKAALAAITKATPPEASQFYGWTEEELKAKWGTPLVTSTVNDMTDRYKMLLYEYGENTGTCFFFYGSDKTVSRGFFKGQPVHEPRRKPLTTEDVVPQLNDLIRQNGERELMRDWRPVEFRPGTDGK